MPVVWASRFGEVSRCIELLSDLNAGDAVSPTSFGLSVHNAISAQYSIARGDRANHTALTAGDASAASAVIEALGLLSDEHEEVLVVDYDAPLPGAYAEFDTGDAPPYAWAWRVARPSAGEPYFSLSCDSPSLSSPAQAWPAGMDLLRFAIGDDASLTQTTEGQCWTWRRHAAAV